MLFCFSMSITYAQDLHIYYNLHKDSLWYVKNGKPTTKLEVRKGKQIYLHLVEYNNYLYSSENVISYHSVLPPEFAGQTSGFLGLVPTLINSLVPGGSALLPLMQAPVFGSMLSVLAPGTNDLTARGSNEDLVEYGEKLQVLETQREMMNAMMLDLNARMNAERYLRSDLSFINNLITNPGIAPSLIKSMLNQYFSEALMIPDQQIFQLKDIPSLVQKMEEIPSLKADLLIKSREYESSLSDFKRLHKRVKNSDHGLDTLYALMKEFENKLPEIEKLNSRMVNSLSADSASAGMDYKEAVQKVFLKYSEIQNNDFSVTYTTEATNKYILFDLKVFLRDSNSLIVDESERQLYKKVNAKVITYGEFGLATSVGVQGARLVHAPESYYVLNNVLLSEPKSRYAPFVASMFNFHYQMSSAYSPAISLGVGLPLNNEDVLGNLSYLVGPSLIVGKFKNIVISGGFIFSKVNRLADGLNVGDNINIGAGQIPTDSRFEQGYFIGISYNIRS